MVLKLVINLFCVNTICGGDEFTGRSYKAEITYITDYAQKDGYVVLGIEGLEEVE